MRTVKMKSKYQENEGSWKKLYLFKIKIFFYHFDKRELWNATNKMWIYLTITYLDDFIRIEIIIHGFDFRVDGERLKS